MKTNEMRLVNVPTVIAACCVLHNVCEVHGKSLNERWIEDSGDDNRELPQPPRVTSRDDSATEKANDIRSALITYFDNNQFMRTM